MTNYVHQPLWKFLGHIPFIRLKNLCFAGPWITAYSKREEHQITKGHQLATIPLLDKEWKISFDFMATSFKGIRQVLHLTTGGVGSGGGAKYGDRTPAIWTHPTKGFLISSAVSGKASYAKWFKALPQPGEWINIEIAQVVEVSNTMYSITIGGKKVFSEMNTNPAKFENVKVFSSSTWYHATSGFIRNLLIENVNGGKLTHPSKK